MYSFHSSWTLTTPKSQASSSLFSSSSSSVLPSSSSTSLWSHVFITIVIILVYTSSASEACFIRNCPKGGKRSMSEQTIVRRQCLPCGLANAGQCVGPAICCSPSFGCHIGTPETEVCQKENERMEPCYITGDVCGSHDEGNCVANGLCCDSDSCAFNTRCQETEDDGETIRDRSQILQLIKKLLRVKNMN